MLCPHCGRDNAEGRKYCLFCYKPLALEPVSPKPEPRIPLPFTVAEPTSPVVSRMAIASLALSFLALIPPLGIAAVVMGHISRSRIAKSNDSLTGMGLAFAGLILSYLQFAVWILIFIGLAGVWHEMNHDLNHNPYLRAALAQRIMQGDPRHTSAAAAAEYRQNAVDALRLIRAREDSSKQAYPGAYVCNLNDLTIADQELNLHVMQSHYQYQVICQPDLQTGIVHGYSVSAVAHFDSDPAERLAYCLDSTGMIRKYGNEESSEAMFNRTFLRHELCPDDGEPVE